MADPRVDREAWAALIARLIQSEAGGNKSQFARLVGVKSTKTIDRWLLRAHDVSADSVRQVASALKLSTTELLTTVGYLDSTEMARQQLAAQIARDVEVVAWVERQQDVPPHLRRQIVDSLTRQIQQQQAELQRRAEEMVDVARRRGETA